MEEPLDNEQTETKETSRFERIIDIFMFREGSEEDARGSMSPIITTGSVVWGILLRATIVIALSFIVFDRFELRQYWWTAALALWFFAVYPAWRQYQLFQKRVEKVSEETLCGSCKYFEQTSQLCKIYDEHITLNYIPCEGSNWEPRHFDTPE
jgi:hypothetical protein